MLPDYDSRNPAPLQDGVAGSLSVDQPLGKTACKSSVGNCPHILSFCPVFTAMHFKLICLYKDGVPLDKDQLAESPSHVRNLVIEDWLEGGSFRRPVRQARLLTETHLIPADIIPPLFDPVAIKMSTNQLTLQGHQIGTREGAAVHYIQAWAVRMTAQAD